MVYSKTEQTKYPILLVTTWAAMIWVTPPAFSKNPTGPLSQCLKAKFAIEKVQACSSAIPSLKNHADLERVYLRRGNAFSELRRFQEAVDDYSAAIQLNPKVAGYYDNRQFAFKALGRLQEALDDANLAVSLAPNRSFVYRSRAIVFDALHRHEDALKDYTTAIQLNPNDAGLYLERGKIYSSTGLNENAIADFSKALLVNPGLSLAQRERGIIYEKMGAYDAAIRDLEAFTAGESNDEEAQSFLNDARTALQSSSATKSAEQTQANPKSEETEEKNATEAARDLDKTSPDDDQAAHSVGDRRTALNNQSNLARQLNFFAPWILVLIVVFTIVSYSRTLQKSSAPGFTGNVNDRRENEQEPVDLITSHASKFNSRSKNKLDHGFNTTILLLCGVFLYVGLAIYSLNNLFIGMREGDERIISRYVDFPSIRSSLKDQLKAVATKQMRECPKDNDFCEIIAGAIVDKIIDAAVDALVTPSGVSRLIKRHEVAASRQDYAISFARFSHKLEIVSPVRFRLVDDGGVSIESTFKDWGWIVTDIRVPQERLPKPRGL
jgi:tetratricopeptide (TPR) repeat protein